MSDLPLTIAIGVILLGGIGVSIYFIVESQKPKKTGTVKVSPPPPPPPPPPPLTPPPPPPPLLDNRVGFQCISGMLDPNSSVKMGLRLNPTGDVECLSLDGKNCVITNCDTTLSSTPSENIHPLACGAAHAAIYGSTGYDTSNHWCSRYMNFLKRVPGPGPGPAPVQPGSTQFGVTLPGRGPLPTPTLPREPPPLLPTRTPAPTQPGSAQFGVLRK